MKKRIPIILMFSLAILSSCSMGGNRASKNSPKDSIEVYVTTADQSMLFKKIAGQFNTKNNTSPYTISLDTTTKYQKMEGFGAAMTGTSCYNLLKMTPENRHKLLVETFDPKLGMGYSYIRVSIGCSDFSMDDYTYCDKKGIENFAINQYDKRDLFPILKEIKAINPHVKILASPWTCPKWMKVTNLKDLKPKNSWSDGQLNPAYYQDYATYFVKYIQAMKTEGFNIDAVTIQNEPLNRGNSASLYMSWQEQRDFIKTALGPKFAANNINTKIICYDHNYSYDQDSGAPADQKGYPTDIYKDADAAKYIYGSAFHAYGGDKSEMLKVHNANPDKGVWFTEMSIGLWGEGYKFAEDMMFTMREIGLGTINNYSQAVIVWNYMLDDKHAPYRPGGCDMCLGAIDINSSDYATMTKNSHYYAMGHLSKVILPGAYRVKVNGYTANDLYYAGFENPDGTLSIVLQNDSHTAMNITVADGKKSFTYNVPAKSVTSYMWRNKLKYR